MSNFLLENESELFCILIIVFLCVFRRKNFQCQQKEISLLYCFSIGEIIFSALGNIMMGEVVRNLCFILCGIFFFGASIFCFQYIFKIREIKITLIKKFQCIFAGVLLGILSFYSLRYGFSVASFVLVFVITALFVIEQNNKIKVDNLTKLYNRYGMDAELKQQLRQYERENCDSFYLIACDLDNFKHINDTWGHPEGDRALILIAGALARVCKKFNSNVFRIGGDEFVIITDSSEEGLASEITKAVKNELDNIDFRNDFNIEMSIGAVLYDGVTSIDKLLSSADKRLYEAKRK